MALCVMSAMCVVLVMSAFGVGDIPCVLVVVMPATGVMLVHLRLVWVTLVMPLGI